MKRLRDYLGNMNPKSTTYDEIYEGKLSLPHAAGHGYTAYTEYIPDSTYWNDEIAFTYERSHKLALDKPTVTISIPIKMLDLNSDDCRHIAAQDYILRTLIPYLEYLNEELSNRKRPAKENGKYYIYSPGGEVIKRNCVYFKEVERIYYKLLYYKRDKTYQIYIPSSFQSHPEYQQPPEMCVNIMIQVQLPFPDSLFKKTIKMLTVDLPETIDLYVSRFSAQKLREAVELNKKQEEIRKWLKSSDYCAFIANGAILPRKGNSALPAENAVPFKSPEQDEIEINGLKGMGIKKGVTVITGGGYSGKSTLLDAISAGIYNHVRGDGREFVITDDTAIKISAEDGRSVKNINLSPFIKWLPNNSDPLHFYTEHASGSTSQAANIIEAVNFGAKLFLIDEDKSATNFMIRDDMMKELIKREPITPFTDRVRQLYGEAGISTILVVGGSGEYLSVADNVIMMDEFHALNATSQAKEIYKNVKNITLPQSPLLKGGGGGAADDGGLPYKTSDSANPHPSGTPFQKGASDWFSSRRLITEKFTSYPKESEDVYSGTERLEISDMGFIIIGDEKIDIRNLHNFISFAQITAVGYMLRYMEVSCKESVGDMQKFIDDLYNTIEEKGIDFIHSTFFSCERWLDMPRKCELAAVINRMRFVDFI